MPIVISENNPYKVKNPDQTNVKPIDCWIKNDASDFFIRLTKYIMSDEIPTLFRHISSPTGDCLNVDRVHDFYVPLGLSCNREESLELGLLDKNHELVLPSSIFLGCKQWDVIHLVFKGKDVFLRLNQRLGRDNYNYGEILPTFEKSLNEIRDRISFGEDDRDYYESVAGMRHTFFRTNSPLCINGPVYRGRLGSDECQEITQQELRSIPILSSLTTRELRTNEVENQNGTVSIIINAPTNEISSIEYLKTSSYLYLFIKNEPQWKYDETSRHRFRDLINPNFAKLIENPKFQNGFEVVSLEDGKLQLRSKLPRVELQSQIISDQIKSFVLS